MGLDAQVIAIGPFSRSVLAALEYFSELLRKRDGGTDGDQQRVCGGHVRGEL